MKKTNTIFIAVLTAIFMLSSSGVSQVAIIPDKIAAFNALLRDLDLNEETQNGYAIAEAEYEQLKKAWKGLPSSDKHQLLSGYLWTGTCVMALLYDLNNEKDWKAHINNMAGYGVQGLALTLSRLNNRITLTAARKMLVDLLHNGSHMFSDGKLWIAEEIKTQANERAGREARHRLEKWEQLINAYQNHPEADKIKAVNEFFNRQITAEADKGSARGCDYWQSPIETLVRGVGDCDDFAMAKYVSLRLLGISAGQLRVAVVKGNFSYRHAVLFFFPQNEQDPWVLDNLAFKYNGMTDSHILRLSARMILHKITPICGVNENELTEFHEGLNEKATNIDPRHSSPQFGTALINSQRVLPPTRG